MAEIKIGDVVVASYEASANSAAIKAATDALTAAKAGTDQAAIDAAQAALDKEKGVKAALRSRSTTRSARQGGIRWSPPTKTPHRREGVELLRHLHRP